MKKRFGELLLERGLISAEQLADALTLQRRRGMRLGAALVARGHLTEAQLVAALGNALSIKVVELTAVRVSAEAANLVGQRFASEHELFPYAVRKERGRRLLSVAMSDPLNYRLLDELSFLTNAQIEPALARASDIEAAITRFYGRTSSGSAAYGKDHEGRDLMKLSDQSFAGESSKMTILRRDGSGEIVDTITGQMRPARSNAPSTGDGPLESDEGRRPPLAPRPTDAEQGALLLTEEVEASVPVDAHPTPLPRGPTPAMSDRGADRGTQRQRPAATDDPYAGSLTTRLAAPVAGGGVGPQLPTIPDAVRTARGPSTSTPRPVPAMPQQTRPAAPAGPVVPVAPVASTAPVAPAVTAPPSYGQVLPAHPAPIAPSAARQAPAFGPWTGTTTAPAAPLLTNAPLLHSATTSEMLAALSFDDALGALLDSTGGAVNAEAFFQLERKFWALMRILARKGLLTNEEFIRELGDE